MRVTEFQLSTNITSNNQRIGNAGEDDATNIIVLVTKKIVDIRCSFSCVLRKFVMGDF